MNSAAARFRFEPYVEFAKKAISREATYRFDVFTSIGSFVVRVYLLRMVWTALYAHNAAPANLPLHAIITYSTVALLMGLVLDIDQTRILHDKLHDGSIATDFMKPINVPLYLFSDGTGEVLFHALLIIPALLLALLLVHIDVPAPGVLAAFGLSFLLGYFVGFFINFILNCVAFWTLEISAVQLILTWVTDLLGGGIIPLILFPPALQHAIFVLPFAAMFSTPLLIYVGQIPPARYLAAFESQLVWLLLLAGVASVIWRARRAACHRSGRVVAVRTMLAVYAQYWRINLLTTLEYRANFLIWFGFTFVYHGSAIAALYIVLQTFPSMNGWSFRDMAFLYGLWMVGHAINNTFFGAIGDIPEHIREGEFDRFLVRPLDTLFQAITQPGQIFPDELLLALVYLGAAIWYSRVQVDAVFIVFVPLIAIGGALIDLGIGLMISTAAFWFIRVDALRWIVLQLEQEFTRYPLAIYSRGVRLLLAFVFPFAFMNYFPATFFLHKTENGLALPPQVGLLTPLIGSAFAAAAYIFWRFGLNRYQGVGH